MSGNFIFFSGQTADGLSNVYKAEKGGIANVRCFGDFGGGTAQVEVAFNDDDWVPAEDGDFTVQNIKLMALKVGASYRINLTGATGANLSADLLDV